MVISCIVCGAAHTALLYPGILQCRECDFIFADLDLTDAELEELYQRNYFFGDEYSDYIADKRVIQKNFRLRLKVLDPFMDPMRHRHLLEIGSAYGFFLELVQSQVETATGIDITQEGVAYARDKLGLDVLKGDFLEYNFAGRMFDVVCMWDTIEHLRQPHLYLERISQYTESGALLAITTGDIGSVNARFKGDKWRLIHPPTHLHYFSRKTLARLLERYGFEVIYNRHCGYYRSLATIMYGIFVLRHGREWGYRLIKKSGLISGDCYLNLYDICYMIARRR